jgi:hypothetical protein
LLSSSLTADKNTDTLRCGDLPLLNPGKLLINHCFQHLTKSTVSLGG